MVLLYMDINELYIITIHVNNLAVSYIFRLYLYYIFTLLYLCVFNKFNAQQSVFFWEGGGGTVSHNDYSYSDTVDNLATAQ